MGARAQVCGLRGVPAITHRFGTAALHSLHQLQFERDLMKRAIAIILEAILFLLVFLAGSLLVAVPSAHLPDWTVNLSSTRYFVLDGLVFMFVLYVLFLAVGAARHRLRSVLVTSTTAVVLALVLGLAMKFGFATR